MPDPSGIGQGQTFLSSTTVTTNGTGIAAINFNLTTNLAIGTWVTVTATNQSTGDTSEFSNAVSTEAVSVSFSMAGYTVASTAGSIMIDVVRTGNLNVAVSVNFATSNGSAIAGQDYTAVAGTLTFPPTATDETFLIPILSNPNRSTSFSTVNLALSQPVGGATLGTISSSTLTITNNNLTVKTLVVNNTGDSGLGTLRQAILDANADQSSGVDNIVFDIPASTAANLNVPVPGFDPRTQTWTISLNSPLPVITHPVAIDGYTQANVGVGYRYPNSLSSQSDNVAVGLSVTGGTYILSIAPYEDDSGALRGELRKASRSMPRLRTSRINS